MLYSEPAERDRLTALMSLINWDNEARNGNPDVSVCPDTLETVLNQHRWSMSTLSEAGHYCAVVDRVISDDGWIRLA